MGEGGCQGRGGLCVDLLLAGILGTYLGLQTVLTKHTHKQMKMQTEQKREDGERGRGKSPTAPREAAKKNMSKHKRLFQSAYLGMLAGPDRG
jgi:hypothetical protein